jgi:DNA helicase-2/ATP-dependent DNA helicase PcrA
MNMARSFKPTRYQTEIFKFIHLEKGNAVVEAVAGSGKTTTIVEAIKTLPGRSRRKIVFLAFNKHIAEELKQRLPSTVQSTTMHAMGLSWIMRAPRGVKPESDPYGKTIRKALRDQIMVTSGSDFEHQLKTDKSAARLFSEHCRMLSELVKLCKLSLALKAKSIGDLSIKHGFIEFGEKEFQLVERYLSDIIKHPHLDTLSFEDMVFYPAVGAVDVTRFDLVFIDECQDLNKAQQTCVSMMLGDGERFIAVGDPYQAIYGFAGADNDSFKEFKNKPNTTQLPLSECFRCGKEIVRFAREIVPGIEHRETSQNGTVRYGSYKEIRGDDYVLCRLNSLLVSFCLDLIRSGNNAKIIGSGIGEDLISLIRSQETTDISRLKLKLAEELGLVKDVLVRSGLEEADIANNSRYAELADQVMTVNVIAEHCHSVDGLIHRIESIFDISKPGITLASIHKAKGLEAKRVFILGDALMPLKKASLEWQVRQEFNLMYVAYTRAREELIFINDYDDYVTQTANIGRSARLDEFLGQSFK